MAWKRSKDGGIDYEVSKHVEHQEQEPESFSAMTVTTKINQEEVLFEPPLTPQQKIHNFRLKQHQRNIGKNYGAYNKRRL